MIVTTPKPHLASLAFSALHEDTLLIGGEEREVIPFVVKIDLGGVTGLVVPLVGKEPPPMRVWILEGEAPTFLKWEGPLYSDGPVWQIELESPLSATSTKER